MNFSNQNKIIISLSVVNIILIIVLLFLFDKHLPYNPEVKILNKQREMQSVQGIARDPVFEETSPDKKNILILYEIPDSPEKQEFLAVKNKDSKVENYIYFLDVYKDSIPNWLGNDFVYFITYCGTSCQGLNLLDINSKQIYHGVLSYMVLDEKRGPYTVFRDWFGQEFNFNGLVDYVVSKTIEEKDYLIFKMKDGEGKSIGQKRFLFTGKALKE